MMQLFLGKYPMQSLILVQACNQVIWCIRSRSNGNCYFTFNPFHLKPSVYFTFNHFHMKLLDLDWMLWIVWLHACTKMSDCTGYILIFLSYLEMTLFLIFLVSVPWCRHHLLIIYSQNNSHVLEHIGDTISGMLVDRQFYFQRD
jgi:hypothetical protein